MAFVHDRPVRFDEVDAAQLVFFARFFGYCHEAMEVLFGELEGGYVGFIKDRRLGVPAVHVDADYQSPLRYGDVVRIALEVTAVGRSSFTLRFTLSDAASARHVATLHHTLVTTDLDRLKSVRIPDDVRALLAQHEAKV